MNGCICQMETELLVHGPGKVQCLLQSFASVGWCICPAKAPKWHKLVLNDSSLHLKLCSRIHEEVSERRCRPCPPLVAGTLLSGFPQTSGGDGNIPETWCAVDLVWVPPGLASLLHPWQRFDHWRAQGAASKGFFAPPCAPQWSNLCPGCSTVAEMWSIAEWSTSLPCFSMEGGSHMLSASLKGLQQSQALISVKMPFPPCLRHLFTLPHEQEEKRHSGSWAIHFCTVEGPTLLGEALLTMYVLLLEYSIPAVKSQSCAESFWVQLFSIAEI